MNLRDVVAELGLAVLTGEAGLDREATGGYCSDLLSDVMAHARPGDVWITLQTHPNVVAVASLTNVAAVVASGGQRPEAASLARAANEGVVILASDQPSFELAGRLHALLAAGRQAR